MYIASRVASRERGPQKVLQRGSREISIVHQHDQRKFAKGIVGFDRLAEYSHLRFTVTFIIFEAGCSNGKHARHAQANWAKPRRRSLAGELNGQSPHWGSGRGDDDLRAFVQRACRSNRACRSSVRFESANRACQSTRSSMCRNMARMSWTSRVGSSSPRHDQQILGQRQLSLPQDGIGLRQQLLRLRRSVKGV